MHQTPSSDAANSLPTTGKQSVSPVGPVRVWSLANRRKQHGRDHVMHVLPTTHLIPDSPPPHAPIASSSSSSPHHNPATTTAAAMAAPTPAPPLPKQSHPSPEQKGANSPPPPPPSGDSPSTEYTRGRERFQKFYPSPPPPAGAADTAARLRTVNREANTSTRVRLLLNAALSVFTVTRGIESSVPTTSSECAGED